MNRSLSSRLLKLATPFLLVGVALVLSRCGTQTNSAASGTFTDVYNSTLNVSCGSCHVPGGKPAADGASIDFTSKATAYNTLTTLKVTGSVAKGTCGSVPLVAGVGTASTNNAAASYMPYVLFSDYTAPITGAGGCTPYSLSIHGGGLNLSAAQEASILAWINAGAPNS